MIDTNIQDLVLGIFIVLNVIFAVVWHTKYYQKRSQTTAVYANSIYCLERIEEMIIAIKTDPKIARKELNYYIHFLRVVTKLLGEVKSKTCIILHHETKLLLTCLEDDFEGSGFLPHLEAHADTLKSLISRAEEQLGEEKTKELYKEYSAKYMVEYRQMYSDFKAAIDATVNVLVDIKCLTKKLHELALDQEQLHAYAEMIGNEGQSNEQAILQSLVSEINSKVSSLLTTQVGRLASLEAVRVISSLLETQAMIKGGSLTEQQTENLEKIVKVFILRGYFFATGEKNMPQ